MRLFVSLYLRESTTCVPVCSVYVVPVSRQFVISTPATRTVYSVAVWRWHHSDILYLSSASPSASSATWSPEPTRHCFMHTHTHTPCFTCTVCEVHLTHIFMFSIVTLCHWHFTHTPYNHHIFTRQFVVPLRSCLRTGTFAFRNAGRMAQG